MKLRTQGIFVIYERAILKEHEQCRIMDADSGYKTGPR